MAHRFARTVVLCAASLLGLSTARADVLILGQAGSYTTIQSAIDAAVDGDVLIVEDGLYAAPFQIDDKALTLLARHSGQAIVHGLCSVENIAPGRSVTLIGLSIKAPDSSSKTHSGLTLKDCAGQVRIQDCDLLGGRYTDQGWPGLPSGHGLETLRCQRVLVVHSSLRGRDHGYAAGADPRAGGDGLRAVDSTVFVYSSLLRGGEGSHETNPSGGPGGAGARVSGWGLFVAGSTLRGGQGGGGDYIGCTTSGDGGDALAIENAQAQLLDNAYLPGAPGVFSTCGPGSPGQAISQSGGAVQHLAGSARDLEGPAWITDRSTTAFTVHGQPGDAVWVLRSERPAWLFVTAFHGLAVIPLPMRVPVVPAGTIGAGGSLIVPLRVGDLPGPGPGWMWTLQALCVEPGGLFYLSSPLQLLVANT